VLTLKPVLVFVTHILRRCQFDRERAHPSYNVVFTPNLTCPSQYLKRRQEKRGGAEGTLTERECVCVCEAVMGWPRVLVISDVLLPLSLVACIAAVRLQAVAMG
jgi:hypothetical protein